MFYKKRFIAAERKISDLERALAVKRDECALLDRRIVEIEYLLSKEREEVKRLEEELYKTDSALNDEEERHKSTLDKMDEALSLREASRSSRAKVVNKVYDLRNYAMWQHEQLMAEFESFLDKD